MGTTVSKIADEIRLHGSWEAAQAFNEEQARKWMHTERPNTTRRRAAIAASISADIFATTKRLMEEGLMGSHNQPSPPPTFRPGGVFEANQRWSDQRILDLERERFRWSQQTFPSASVSGCLFHLKKEIREICESLEKGSPDVVEFADAQMMLWDAMQRCGISLDELFNAFSAKFEKNKLRKWQQRPEGHYEHEKGHHD